MTRRAHILLAVGLGVAVVAAAQLAPRLYARVAYGTLKAHLKCGNVLTVTTSAEKRTLGESLVFCGFADGRPYLLVGPACDDLLALPIGDGGRPSFVAQEGNRFTLDCGDRVKTVEVIGGQCRVVDR